MKLLGFNFHKINIEKLSDSVENLKINSNVNISEIKTVKADLFKSKEDLLGIKFTYTIDYNPDFAKIEFAGNILISIEPKQAKDILKNWGENKISEDFKIPLFNMILQKSSVKALELEEEMNLPYHIPMPSLRKPEDQEEQK